MSVYEQLFKKYGLSPTQKEIINIVGNNKVILEVGPSTGYMTNLFLKNLCIVDVVETDKKALSKTPKGVRKKINYSIEDDSILKALSRDYDFIVLADVLEHLVDPQKALQTLHKIASKQTRLLISLPNIASWDIRKQLFFKGDFEYRDSGVLDKTHLHFYTPQTLPKLLSKNSWEVEKILGTITHLPFEHTIIKIPMLGFIFKKLIYPFLVEKNKNLAYYHFLTEAVRK